MMNRSDDIADSHRLSWDRIPWVINGSASEEDRRGVEEHLRGCDDCRAEFEFQRRLHAAMNHETVTDRDAAPPLQRLWARIDDADHARSAKPLAIGAGRTSRRRFRMEHLVRGLAAAIMVETIGLAVLGHTLWQRNDAPAAYRTLTSSDARTQGATIRVVLAPTLTLAELQPLLARVELRIVDGPSEAGVYSLAPLRGGDDAANSIALAQLRTDPGVRFAEPIDPPSRPIVRPSR